MNARDAMLETIRRGLEQSRGELAAVAASAPHGAPPFVHPAADDLVAQFVVELERLDARPHRCPTGEATLDALRQILVEEHASEVLAWPEADVGLPGLDRLLETMGVARREGPRGPGAIPLQEMAAAAVGITGVDVAIAESGTLVLAGGSGRGRLASLLAPVHVAIVHEAQLVRGLGEAIARLRARDGSALFERRSTLTCITGPSRTADIELTLTLGVHGPGREHVLIRTGG